MRVEVLLEPVMADRAYMAGEELDLSEHDAQMLARYGIVKILVQPKIKAKPKAEKPEHDEQTPPEP